MASFDKFIKDLEKRQNSRKEKIEILRKQDEEHHQRRRVRLYSERWSNAVRYSPSRGKK